MFLADDTAAAGACHVLKYSNYKPARKPGLVMNSTCAFLFPNWWFYQHIRDTWKCMLLLLASSSHCDCFCVLAPFELPWPHLAGLLPSNCFSLLESRFFRFLGLRTCRSRLPPRRWYLRFRQMSVRPTESQAHPSQWGEPLGIFLWRSWCNREGALECPSRSLSSSFCVPLVSQEHVAAPGVAALQADA